MTQVSSSFPPSSSTGSSCSPSIPNQQPSLKRLPPHSSGGKTSRLSKRRKVELLQMTQTASPPRKPLAGAKQDFHLCIQLPSEEALNQALSDSLRGFAARYGGQTMGQEACYQALEEACGSNDAVFKAHCLHKLLEVARIQSKKKEEQKP